MRDKDEWQPVPQLARYARSNLVLHLQGPLPLIPSVLSLPSEERTALDGRKMLPCSIRPPSIIFSIRPKLLRLKRLSRCHKLHSLRSEFSSAQYELVLLFTNLLPVAFACECFLHALLLAGLQVKGVALYLFDNVLRLHLPLETTKSILQRLAFLNTYFCQD